MAIDDILKLILKGGDDIGRTVIRKRAEQMALPKIERIQPAGARLMPETDAAYLSTMGIVPQTPFRQYQPDLSGGAKLPAGGRMGPIIEAQDELSTELARRMTPGLGTQDQYFYHTGPIYQAVADADVAADPFMKRFAAYFGGTSPRTKTEENMLNASMLQYRAGQGLPMDRPVLGLAGDDAANDVGYAMITGMHPDLASRLEAVPFGNFANNPKPSSFAQNTLGNLQGTTVDTHAIRGALLSFDSLYPGQIPKEFFKNTAAYNTYKADGINAINLDSALNDSLQKASVGGVKSQVEYGPMADIYDRTASKLNIAPAEGQALGWFGMGQDTGLRSQSRSIVGLMNDRINVTAQLLGIPQETVARLYFQGRIPLASAAGVGLLSNQDEQPSQSDVEAYLAQRGM